MSTILEALKKSERERKRNNLPTLSDMPPPQERSTLPITLLIAIGVLLILVLGFLGVQWWLAKNNEGESITISGRSTAAPAEQNESVTQGADIVVNVVSFSAEPGQSFAMIDGKMVRENEFVRAGLKVEKIEQNAVILNLRGERIRRAP